MDETAYRAALRATLDAHDGPALERIRALLAALPEAAREIHVVVFPDQDGEGAFSVHVSLDGPDLYVLNRAIEPHRTLFEVIHGEEGFEPDLPMFGRTATLILSLAAALNAPILPTKFGRFRL